MNVFLKRIVSALIVVSLFVSAISVNLFADQGSSTLAPWLSTQSGNVRRLIYFALHVPNITYAQSDAAKALLERYKADVLLLQNGSYLVSRTIFEEDQKIIDLFETRDVTQILHAAEINPAVERALVRLTRVILHENVEKYMRVIAATDSRRYQKIKEFILLQGGVIRAYNEYLSSASRKAPSTNELLVNDITASAFELIFLKNAGIVGVGDLRPSESALLETAETIFSANRHNYFDAPFWDERELNTAVTRSLHAGYAGAIAAHPGGDDAESDLSAGEVTRSHGKQSVVKAVIGKGQSIDIPVPHPRGVSVSRDKKMIAVASYTDYTETENGTVYVISLETGKLLRTIGEGKDIDVPLLLPYGVLFLDDNETLIVTNRWDNTILTIGLRTKNIIRTIDSRRDIDVPLSGPAYLSTFDDPRNDIKTLVIPNWGNHTVSVIDMQKTSPLYSIGEGKDIDVPLVTPKGASVSSDNKTLAISSWGNHTVFIIDLKTKKALYEIGNGKDVDVPLDSPEGVATFNNIFNNHRMLAIANSGGNNVLIIDLETRKFVCAIDKASGVSLSSPRGVSISSDNEMLAVASSDKPNGVYTVSLIDLVSVMGAAQESAAIEKVAGVEAFLRDDITKTVRLYCEEILPALKEGMRYEIRYNESMMDASYKELMEEYISILNERFPSSEFKLIKSSFEDGSLFQTKRYLKNGTNPVGEGALRAIPEEGELTEYLIRVVAMINITIAASSVDEGRDPSKNAGLFNYISSQYRSLTASDLPLTGDINIDAGLIRNIFIILPKSYKLDPNIQAVKNNMMRSLLKNA